MHFTSLIALDNAVINMQRWVKESTGRRTSITKDFALSYTLDTKGSMIKSSAVLFARFSEAMHSAFAETWMEPHHTICSMHFGGQSLCTREN
jgi:hypothetical protein